MTVAVGRSGRWVRWRFAARQLSLPLGGRAALFLGADAALLAGGWFAALLRGATPPVVYTLVVLLPMLTLGVLAMADLVAVERRAGCLGLALALPASWRYFERRLALVVAAVVAQSWLIILVMWALSGAAFPLVLVGLHAAAVAAFLGAASLFWGARLQAPGAVGAATVVCAALALPWIAVNAVPDPAPEPQRFIGDGSALGTAAANAGVLLGLAFFLLAFARRRLARAEGMLQ